MQDMKRVFFSIILIISTLAAFAQPIFVDGIVAIVGREIIMKSDIENAFAEYSSQFGTADGEDEVKCDIFEKLVFEKLMLHQADLDSVVATDQQVEDRINAKIAYFLQQVGGDTKILEDYFHKTLAEIKKDMFDQMRTQMLVEEVQAGLLADITITPSEVKSFFDNINYDSLPTIQPSYEFGHIVKTPPVSADEIADIKTRLTEFRERVLRGEKFAMLARLYSDDPGSASKGGELGFVTRGTLYPEFEAAAFKLKSGEISNIVQTKAGYHIIQMLERRGDKVNVAHILIQPKPSPDEQVKAIEFLDSIKKVIVAEEMNFSDAAQKFSDDMNKNSGGWVVNPYTGSSRFDQESMGQTVFATVGKLIPGEYSDPVPYISEEGTMSYRIIYLKSKIAAHKPNLTEDYDVIKNAALEDKKNRTIDKWTVEKVKVTSIKIADEYKFCPFYTNWQIP